MILNPFEEQLEQAQAKAHKLMSDLKVLVNEIDWYESTDLDILSNSRLKLEHELQRQLFECTEAHEKVKNIKANIIRHSPAINSLWNPKNWFDSQQRDLRSHLADLKKSLEIANSNTYKAQEKLQEIKRKTSSNFEEIARYEDFDFDVKSENRRLVANQFSQQRRKAERIALRKQNFDDALEPIVKQIRDAEQKKSEALEAKFQAQRFDDELSEASNSYERAMVHEKCESKFGTGSPRKAVSRKDAEIRRLERDLEKLIKRARLAADKASRDIQKLVFDGNNLCYQGDTFIGLVALQCLLPGLADEYKITVVFDASVRRALRCGDSDVRDALGNNIEVHVVATGIKADEIVLDLAGADKTAFVVSNDRFAEFGEKPAVLDHRVIRHEIVSGQILIHDLGVSETFRQ
ncbi:hypothetical protein L9G15_01005 [Shewanella sp. A3A]|nr:hypothetical protein [Shewanella ferrihydritica]